MARPSSPDLDADLRAMSPLPLAWGSRTVNDLGTQSKSRNTNAHTYQMDRAKLGPAQPFDDAEHLRKRLSDIFGREDTPNTIVPDSPGRMIPPDPNSYVEDPGYIEPTRYRSVSAVPSLAGAPPLHFVWSQSNSQPNSVAGGDDNQELADDLEGDAYDELLNGLDDLDIEPEDLDLDDLLDPDGDENSVDDDFYACIDDADQEPSADSSVAEGEDTDENLEDEQRERPPVFNDEPDVDPDEPEAADNAAVDEPDLLRNAYIRVWIESVFGGSTREQTRRTLLSHKSMLEALVGNLAGELADTLRNAFTVAIQGTTPRTTE
ncbi:hypothetical protein FRC09_004460 [Ceratobasidium sp. 395]|nr:hypothetical protein FRC09_004460 [Ceratobasidium sp. 395]